MTDHDPHDHHPQLVGLASRILGSVAEAEDAVQEAYLRLLRQTAGTIDNAGAWLTTVTSRVCLDRLDSAQARRERYVGDDHAAIAGTLERSETACRQLVSRARKHVRARRPRFEQDPKLRAQVVERLLTASTTGAVDELLALLAPDVSLHFDGGGEASAGLRPVRGPDRVVRYVQGAAKAATQLHLAVRWLNGSPGLIAHRADGSVDTAFVLDVADGVVRRINVIRNPDKLTYLANPWVPACSAYAARSEAAGPCSKVGHAPRSSR